MAKSMKHAHDASNAMIAKVVKNTPSLAAIVNVPTLGERSYALARETKGTWLYDWENAPEGTPDWAKKWYILKSDFPVCPGRRIKVAMTVAA